MADRIEEFNATVAANGSASPTFTFSVPNGDVTALDINFPDGCAGLVQVLVVYAGAQVIPKALGTFLTGNDQTYHFELANLPTGQGWGVALVNSDIFAHTIRFTFHVDEIVITGDITLPPIILLPQASG